MSGILGEAITPCPSRSRSSGASSYGGNSTLDSFIDNDTAYEATGQIGFTTEIRAPTLTGVRPRRANRTGSGFQIHDEGKKAPAPAEKRRRPNGTTTTTTTTRETSVARKSSLLAQPAQRIRPRAKLSVDSSQSVKQDTKISRRPGSLESNPKKEPSHGNRTMASETSQTRSSSTLKNNIRRNTVYAPPDDTTVPSVFMGLFSPLKKQPSQFPPKETNDTQFTSLDANVPKQQARKSLATTARRAPLQPSRKLAQDSVFRVDVAGKNGGKENIPPGMLFETERKGSPRTTKPLNNRFSNLSLKDNVPRNASRQVKTAKSAELPKIAKSTEPKRSILQDNQSNVESSPSASIGNRRTILADSNGSISSASLDARASALSIRLGRSGSTSKTGCAPTTLKKLNSQYPKLTEDIKTPALYEDDWLSHQETVITQLVNSLFEHSNGGSNPHDKNNLQLELLELYHTDLFIQLYKRLQASLSCGNLSISKHVLARSYRLRQDIGLRRKFLDIWIHSYNLHALAAAAETVIGRKIPSDHDLFESNLSGGSEERGRKIVVKQLERFLDTFLLRNDDLHHSVSGVKEISADDQAMAYQRTVLRCIMIVSVLDQARKSPGCIIPRQLFVPTSQFKSSVDVLQALTRLLLPSRGDITKQLGHLGFHLSYSQHQLQEYNYQMENFAVDMRDGVRLTRIVEILFFTPKHARPEGEDQTEATLNTGEALSLLGEHADAPLSKHLRYPCVSRAAKLFNAQIALSALRSIKGSKPNFGDIRPEEVVDGYREKTIALLWALVSGWGLAGLVDWEDVNKEISRLKRKSLASFAHDQLKIENLLSEEHFDGTDHHAQLLRQWAGLLAGLKGLRINNMTTSFADGRIYESIVDEYEPYITGDYNLDTNKRPSSLSLRSRLRLLGCSSQFAQLISPSSINSHILNHECTLGTLAFLCSRLLAASKRARAATILQRAWRARLDRRDILRRSIAKNLATHCATVVQTRNEILCAKEVIVRWWRLNRANNHQKLAPRPRDVQKSSRNPSTRRL